MKLQQIQMAVNRVDETDLPSQNMKSTNTSMGDTPRAAGNLILNILCRKHRLFATVVLLFIETAIDPTLAVRQFLGYSCAHSKSLFVFGLRKFRHLVKPRKCRGISFFSKKPANSGNGVRLVKD